MKDSNRLAVSFLLVALLAYAFAGCATLPAATPAQGAAEAAQKCLENGPCFVVQVDNAGDYEGTIRLNGAFIGRVPGNASATLFVREANLVDGRCAQFSVFFRVLNRAAVSTKECGRPGGYFALQVDPLYRVWLTPWGGA